MSAWKHPRLLVWLLMLCIGLQGLGLAAHRISHSSAHNNAHHDANNNAHHSEHIYTEALAATLPALDVRNAGTADDLCLLCANLSMAEQSLLLSCGAELAAPRLAISFPAANAPPLRAHHSFALARAPPSRLS